MAIERRAYWVEPDERNACRECAHGTTYNIVGPDDVALSMSYYDEEIAEQLAEALSDAYEAGRLAALSQPTEAPDGR